MKADSINTGRNTRSFDRAAASCDRGAAGKAGSKIREAILKYLERFLKDLGADRAYKYCSHVFDTCLFAYKREDSNPAKAATFLPVQCILEWDLPIPDDKTASELVKTYQSSYQRLRSLTGTVKGDILQTLGQVLEAKPQVDLQPFFNTCSMSSKSDQQDAIMHGIDTWLEAAAGSLQAARHGTLAATGWPVLFCRVLQMPLASITCGCSMSAQWCCKLSPRQQSQTKGTWLELLQAYHQP